MHLRRLTSKEDFYGDAPCIETHQEAADSTDERKAAAILAIRGFLRSAYRGRATVMPAS
jgi:hypothetical protein